MSRICIDASLVLLWLLPQKFSEKAEALWASWQNKDNELIAPPLILAEVPSVIRKGVFNKKMLAETGEAAFQAFCDLHFKVMYSEGLHIEAWELAKRFNMPKIYDMHYIALAKLEGCEFWTGDNRLVNAVKSEFDWVRYIGEYSL